MSCLHHVPSPQGIHSLCLVSYREFNNLSLMKKSSYFSGDGHMLGLFRVGYEGAVALIPGIQGAWAKGEDQRLGGRLCPVCCPVPQSWPITGGLFSWLQPPNTSCFLLRSSGRGACLAVRRQGTCTRIVLPQFGMPVCAGTASLSRLSCHWVQGSQCVSLCWSKLTNWWVLTSNDLNSHPIQMTGVSSGIQVGIGVWVHFQEHSRSQARRRFCSIMPPDAFKSFHLRGLSRHRSPK